MSEDIDRGELRALLTVIHDDGKKTRDVYKGENDYVSGRGAGEAHGVRKVADHFDIEFRTIEND